MFWNDAMERTDVINFNAKSRDCSFAKVTLQLFNIHKQKTSLAETTGDPCPKNLFIWTNTEYLEPTNLELRNKVGNKENISPQLISRLLLFWLCFGK